MATLLDRVQIAAGFVPVDMATGANNGKWVNLTYYGRILIVFYKAAGSGSEDPVLTIQQASDVSGTGAKSLTFTTYYKNSGADLGAIGLWTQVTQSAANTCTLEGSEQTICAVEFQKSDLDVANSFDCVRATVADVGATAQVGCVFYLLGDPTTTLRLLPSAIAD